MKLLCRIFGCKLGPWSKKPTDTIFRMRVFTRRCARCKVVEWSNSRKAA